MDFLGSRWMETAPTSIEVLLRPTLGQSDEPSDLRGFLSPTSVYSTWQSPGGNPSNYESGATSPNFSDRANHDERTPYSVYGVGMGWLTLRWCAELVSSYLYSGMINYFLLGTLVQFLYLFIHVSVRFFVHSFFYT